MTKEQEEVFEGEVHSPEGTAVSSPVSGSLPVPMNKEAMLAMIAKAELAVEFQNRIKQIALKLTNNNDWCKLGKNFMLEHTGQKKIGQAFGVSIIQDGPAIRRIEKDELGEYIVISIPFRASWHVAEISELGICSSRDLLLGKVGDKFKPLSEVNIVNVERKAHTSGIRRAIQTILALYPTEEDMKAAGLNPEAIASEHGVSYGAGIKGGSTDNADLTARKQEVQRILLEMYGSDKYADALEDITSFEKDGKKIKGKRSLKDVSEKQFNYLEKEIRQSYNDYIKSLDASKGGKK